MISLRNKRDYYNRRIKTYPDQADKYRKLLEKLLPQIEELTEKYRFEKQLKKNKSNENSSNEDENTSNEVKTD